ncbi:MAG: hypothetical protein KGJ21_06135 [Pseudomonadota bacterium]|nr:hypothetical protein [Pseudomonadota bacterium]
MEFLGSFLMAVFIALLIGTAMTFGFVLLVWFAGLTLAATALLLLRQWWRRGMFLYHGRMRPPPPPAPKKPPPEKMPRVIDAEFEEIED